MLLILEDARRDRGVVFKGRIWMLEGGVEGEGGLEVESGVVVGFDVMDDEGGFVRIERVVGLLGEYGGAEGEWSGGWDICEVRVGVLHK